MNEENNYEPVIHTFATDKIQSKLVNLMFSVEDTKKQLRTGIYGGVTKESLKWYLTVNYVKKKYTSIYLMHLITKTTN